MDRASAYLGTLLWWTKCCLGSILGARLGPHKGLDQEVTHEPHTG